MPSLPNDGHAHECGRCALEGPDQFGQYDLVPSYDCPYHGEGPWDEDARQGFEAAKPNDWRVV